MEDAKRHQEACVESQRQRQQAEEELGRVKEQIRFLDRGRDERPVALNIHAANILPSQGPMYAPLSPSQGPMYAPLSPRRGDEIEAAVRKAEARWRLAENRATEAEEEAAVARRSVAGQNPLAMVNLMIPIKAHPCPCGSIISS